MPSSFANAGASASTASSAIAVPPRFPTPSMSSSRQRLNSEFVNRALEKIAPRRSQSWNRTQSQCAPVKSASRRVHDSNVIRESLARRSAARSAETFRQTVSRALLGAVRRQGNGDESTIRGGHEPVDRRRARLVDGIRIDDDPRAGHVVEIGQRHEEWLLFRRLVLEHEVRRPGPLRPLEPDAVAASAPGHRLGLGDLLRALPHRVVRRQVLENRPCLGVLRGCPRLRLVGRRVLEPAVVLADRHSVVGRADRDPRRVELTC